MLSKKVIKFLENEGFKKNKNELIYEKYYKSKYLKDLSICVANDTISVFCRDLTYSLYNSFDVVEIIKRKTTIKNLIQLIYISKLFKQ